MGRRRKQQRNVGRMKDLQSVKKDRQGKAYEKEHKKTIE